MGFEVIPAIDVAGGRLALFTPDGPTRANAFGGDPLDAARAYAAAGARRVHVVDLDLAFDGVARNLETVRAIARLGLRVQGSGGIATGEDARAVLDAGADRVVLGSGALADERDAVRTIAELAERVLVGIEVDDRRIRSRGAARVDLPLAETLGWLVGAGARAFLVTAVARAGTLQGPDVATIKRVVRSGRPVIAAGGIANLDDLRAVRRAGATGAIVGRAALEGSIPLSELLDGG
ncbi:MAG TPA: HisA/HisF-related TIM barrel protein [Actinomycetota bacterium]|jgi:phosphoribosylformimino-5-aminoimidazole carboxamide ribonucleotide (ProFAR) isomerase|nr:HisA/HisF-related TIM barrel protein [Actinomycetota bacterium]